MTRIRYVEPCGRARDVEVDQRLSVMEGAILNMVPGIEAECGGVCVCGTCHVYVDEAYGSTLCPPNATEHEMLDAVASERRPTSRLSCQIKVAATLDGLTVYLPERQT